MKTYFEFAKHHTGYKQEILAGIATFLTMAYIIVVNPAILMVLRTGQASSPAVMPTPILSGRPREVPAGMWVFAALSILFYIFYPYR